MLSARYSCQILMKFELYRQILEKYSQISNFMKFRTVGAELLRAGGRTDGPKINERVTDAFRNCTNAPNTQTQLL